MRGDVYVLPPSVRCSYPVAPSAGRHACLALEGYGEAGRARVAHGCGHLGHAQVVDGQQLFGALHAGAADVGAQALAFFLRKRRAQASAAGQEVVRQSVERERRIEVLCDVAFCRPRQSRLLVRARCLLRARAFLVPHDGCARGLRHAGGQSALGGQAPAVQRRDGVHERVEGACQLIGAGGPRFVHKGARRISLARLPVVEPRRQKHDGRGVLQRPRAQPRGGLARLLAKDGYVAFGAPCSRLCDGAQRQAVRRQRAQAQAGHFALVKQQVAFDGKTMRGDHAAFPDGVHVYRALGHVAVYGAEQGRAVRAQCGAELLNLGKVERFEGGDAKGACRARVHEAVCCLAFEFVPTGTPKVNHGVLS